MNVEKSWSGARNLLRHVRDIMASDGTHQDRLDKIVATIALEMNCRVCSVYVRRAGEVLELFSTKGLKSSAVHQTRLRVGEGIVGEIAARETPLAVRDVSIHATFVYRPETGEEKYQSMAGVPIKSGQRLVGVLVIQNQETRNYGYEEMETLETISMVIAEMIASGGLVSGAEQTPTDGIGLKPLRLEAVSLSPGLAIGHAVLHRPHTPIKKMVAENIETEHKRLKLALKAMISQLDKMMKRHIVKGTGDHIDILEAYLIFAKDRGWEKRIQTAINSGLTAEAAIVRVQNETRKRLATAKNPIIREKILDLEDLTQRLLQHLDPEKLGNRESYHSDTKTLTKDAIIIARKMGPAELMDYDNGSLKAIVLEEGSSTAHVAIVARGLGLPLLGHVKNILSRVEPMDRIIVDGNNAACFVRPSDNFSHAFAKSLESNARKQAEYKKSRHRPTITRDNIAVELSINAGLLIDLKHLHETGAKGVGLYRTEIPFMMAQTYPDVETQTALYQKIFTELDDKPITFRTLDIGWDKAAPYLQNYHEENPAMGWRAIRIAMDRPFMLRQQLRAMLLAAEGRTFSVMFPMITTVDEFIQARQLLNYERDNLAAKGHAISDAIKTGAMLEVPALAFQLDNLLQEVDFLSIGSNDLHQFLFACDRGSPRLDGYYDSLSPAMLNFLKMIIAKTSTHNVALSVCGEMAGIPLVAMVMIGLGITKLSMAPPAIGPVSAMVRSLDSQFLPAFIDQICAGTGKTAQNDLMAFARDHGVQVA